MQPQLNRWTGRAKALVAIGAGLLLIGLGVLGRTSPASTNDSAAIVAPTAETAATASIAGGVSAERPATMAPAASRQTQQAQAVAPTAPQYKVEEYTIQNADTFWTIAERYHTDVNSIMSMNVGMRDSSLQVGAKVQVPNFTGTVAKVGSGDTLSGLAGMYGLTVNAIVTANKLSSSDQISIGQQLVLPGAKVPDPIMLASRGDDRVATGLPGLVAWPLQGPITSAFGPRWGTMHTGIDIGVSEGTPVHAAAGGTVVEASWDGGYGECIIVEHPGGVRTRYAHLSRYKVSVGDKVDRGDVIGLSGNTGHSTGPHLHFEVIIGSRTVDPMNYLP